MLLYWLPIQSYWILKSYKNGPSDRRTCESADNLYASTINVGIIFILALIFHRFHLWVIIISVIKSKAVLWERQVARMGKWQMHKHF
jgi:hypothetical protein